MHSPNGVFTARSTAEVRADHQDGRAYVFRPIEREIRVISASVFRLVRQRCTTWDISLVGEQERSVSDAFNPLQITSRNDEVGVDVRPVQNGHSACVCTKRFHDMPFLNLG